MPSLAIEPFQRHSDWKLLKRLLCFVPQLVDALLKQDKNEKHELMKLISSALLHPSRS